MSLTDTYTNAVAYLTTIDPKRGVTMNLQWAADAPNNKRIRCHIHLTMSPGDDKWFVINSLDSNPALAVSKAIAALEKFMQPPEIDLFS